jgi:uncharacterized protein (TIGR02246 family)
MRRAIVFATAEAAEEAFYDAMQRGDVAGMMALWADDEDVVCVHPNGSRLVGIEAIRNAFEQMFAQGGVDVRPADVRIHQAAVLAVHNLVEKVLVSGRSGSQVVECVATNVYVKHAAGWRMVLHHAAAAGDASNPEVGAGPAVLH